MPNDLRTTALAAGFNPELDEYELTELGCYVLADEKFMRDVNTLGLYDNRLGAPGPATTGDEILYAVLAAYSHADSCGLRNRIFAKRHREIAQEQAEERQRRARIRTRLLNRRP